MGKAGADKIEVFRKAPRKIIKEEDSIWEETGARFVLRDEGETLGILSVGRKVYKRGC